MEARSDFLAAALALGALSLYLLTLSPSLEEYDSINFALGIIDFNVTRHQPHPPGYPVYILLGKIFNLFLDDPRVSLVSLSALSGAVSVFLVYLMGKALSNPKTGLMAASITAITPMFWIDSLKAMSDMPALAFALAALYFLYLSMVDDLRRYFFWGCFSSGVAIGVRFHNLFLLLPIILFLVLSKNWKISTVSMGIVFFLIAVLLWLIPMVILEGVDSYFSAAASQFKYRVSPSNVSILGSKLSFHYLASRLFFFMAYFGLGGYGLQSQPVDLISIIAVVAMTSISFLGILKLRNKRKEFCFFGSGLSVYLLMIYIALPPSNPRYLLILVPFLSLFWTMALNCVSLRIARNISFLLLAFLLLSLSAPLAHVLHTQKTPPEQVLDVIEQKYGKGRFPVMRNGEAGRHLDYYSDRFETLPPNLDCSQIEQRMGTSLGLFSFKAMEKCPNLECHMVYTAARDFRVHQKHHQVNLYQCFLARQKHPG